MADVLREIFARKAELLVDEERAESYAHVRDHALRRSGERRPLLKALRGAGFGVIAEIKRASPSAGTIAEQFDTASIARAYEAGGADAISVLTEAERFLGDLSYLDVVRAATHLPLLRKDFLSTRYHVAQAAAHGAVGSLRSVAGLYDDALTACIDEARAYALDVLVEVHDRAELERALRLGATFVGINNRDLRTLQIDLAVSERLLPLVPDGVLAISESGVRSAADATRLRVAGARGLLVGESLMREGQPERLLAELKTA